MNQDLQELSKWTGIIGVIYIIFGIIAAIAGLFALLIGSVPGIIQIILGSKLLKVKKHADEAIFSNVDDTSVQISYMISKLASYFKLQGLLMVVSFIVEIILRAY